MTRRLTLAVLVLAVLVGACSRHSFNLTPACPRIGESYDDSEVSGVITLIVQSVPDASRYPCVAQLNPGWQITRVDAERDRSTIVLSSDRLGFGFLEVRLTPECTVPDDATIHQTEPDEDGATLYEDIDKTLAGPHEEGEYEGSWWYVFDRGCVEFRFDAEGAGVDEIDADVRDAFSFFDRSGLDDLVEREIGIRP